MIQISENLNLLNEMYQDDFFPNFLVDKLKLTLLDLISFLKNDHYTIDQIQSKLDEITNTINCLQTDFENNNSQIESVARDSIATSIESILKFYHIDIDLETATREREW